MSALRDAVDPNLAARQKTGSTEEAEIAQEQWRMYVRARDAGHEEYIKEARMFDAFYRGEQWAQSDLDKLQAEGRPALTINMVLSTVNVLLGEQTSRRVDIQYKPRSNASQESATAYTKLTMALMDANNADWVESTVFADGVIQDRGYYDVRMDWEDSEMGDLRITALDPTEVILDPDASEYDPKTWKEVTVSRWMSLDDIESTYGKEKADALRTTAEMGRQYDKDSIQIVARQTFGDDEMNEYGMNAAMGPMNEETKRQVRSVRIIDRQFYKNTRVFCLIDPNTGKRRDLPTGWTKKEAVAFGKKFGADVFPKTKRQIRWRVTCDRVVLHDEWSPYSTFTVIPYFPYFRRGRPFGLVRNLISPQEQINKISSQELAIINSTANGGWVMEHGSLHGMTADDLAEQGGKTGLVLETLPGKNPPEKIKPNQVPTGMAQFGSQAHGFFREISGVNNAMLGLESAEVSGVALESKEARGHVQLQVPLDNLRRTRHLLSRKVQELIEEFMPETRVFQTSNDLSPGAAGEDFVINEPQEDGSVKNDVRGGGEYDLVITTMPARDDFNDAQFAEVLNLRNAGVEVPDDYVVRYSHLEQKNELAEEIRQLQGRGEQTPEQIEQAQMMQELEINTLKAELEELQAKAENLRSGATLNEAKAVDLIEQDDRELNKLDQKMAQVQQEIGVRERLAVQSAASKREIAQMNMQKAQQKPTESKPKSTK